MPIDSSVAELLTAQLFVLVQEAPDPIYFYINSTGIAVRRGGAQQQGRSRGRSSSSRGPPPPEGPAPPAAAAAAERGA
jgi:hypothetical protein